jgi:N-acylneuraminate cytidylyltransferase
VKHGEREHIAFFLPTRKGSERVVNKNTRPFAGVQGGLLAVKLRQLLEVNSIEEIVLSTNDERSMEVASSMKSGRIRIVERPQCLCLSSTNLEDIIDYIPTVINTEHIFWVHVTAPFVTADIYNNAVEQYRKRVIEEQTFDSVLSVTKIQQYILDAAQNKYLSHDRTKLKWPRTQDLRPLYGINSAFFINSRENYLNLRDRIGNRPYLYELDKTASLDIDWGDDFALAEMIYRVPPPPRIIPYYS